MAVVTVSCEKCGTDVEVKTEYFQVFGADAYCQDCLVHTKCRSCGRGLRLQPSRYKELGGDPVVCGDCSTPKTSSSTKQRSQSGTFWDGLTSGEKVVFPLLVLSLIALLGYYAWAYSEGRDVNTGVIPAGLVILLIWTYRRGKKNSP